MSTGTGRGTSTYNFGAGRRENHDSTDFYARFAAPEISADEALASERPTDGVICGDARTMTELPDASVALVVTSPPYFVGKQYEEAVGQGAVPASYLEYLELLRAVFSECKRVLEPGGRIAVNVANLGRRPYRSLAADVVRILQDDLHLLLRGEIIWQKGEGATGSCAWGSYKSAANPVLRDVSERVLVASKGRFDRALNPTRRGRIGLPCRNTIGTDEFLESTLDVWHLPAESARRVGHPAPFPVELPRRLIELYTYADDLVLDPFTGSGSAGVAALRTGRRFVGYDLDAGYVELARQRLAEERARVLIDEDEREEALRQAAASGQGVATLARQALEQAGFSEISESATVRRSGGLTVPLSATDQAGRRWSVEVAGAFTVQRAGMEGADLLWRTIGRLAVLQRLGCTPLLLLATHLPRRGSAGDLALRALGPEVLGEALELFGAATPAVLGKLAGGQSAAAGEGFWGQVSSAGPRRAGRPKTRREPVSGEPAAD